MDEKINQNKIRSKVIFIHNFYRVVFTIIEKKNISNIYPNNVKVNRYDLPAMPNGNTPIC